jgi:hypothetical protein
LSASVVCNRSRIVAMGRPIHGKPFKLYYFLRVDSFDHDRLMIHKNVKKQFDMQGFVHCPEKLFPC